MESFHIFLFIPLLPLSVSSPLLPDTLLLSESLSHFGQCTLTILIAKLNTSVDASKMSTDVPYEIEPLKVSKKCLLLSKFKSFYKPFDKV